MQLPSPALAPQIESAQTDVHTSPDVLRDPRLRFLPEHLEPLRLLGQGGSSVVYEALHTRLKVKVALKLLTIQAPYAEQAEKRMLREAELYALLDDPRIPRVYDVNELPDGTPYVVMEMVPGESLEELLQKRGALPPSLALSIASEVLLALVSVHERGVLHRDVKPANVILSVSEAGLDQVRLVDFGIAKMSTRGSGEEAVTQRGALVGTPHYMAPERLAGHPADASTDVYAVGIMLYEMLAGRVPFTGTTLPAIMSAVMRQTPAPLQSHVVSLELSALVMKAMAREPGDRFASARDMLLAIEALQARPTLSVVEALPGDHHDLPVRRRGRFWFLTTLVSTLLIVTGFLLADRLLRERAEMRAESGTREPVVPVARPAQALPAQASAPAASAVPPLQARDFEPESDREVSPPPVDTREVTREPEPVEEPRAKSRRSRRMRFEREARAAEEALPEPRAPAPIEPAPSALPSNPY